MAALLGPSDWPDVRAALDARLNETLLPDRVIASPIYADEARRRARAKVPDHASLTAEQQATMRAATIFLLAALVAPAVPIVVREQDKDYSYQREAPDFKLVAQELRARADELFAELAGEIVAENASTYAGWMFGRASADRGVF